MMVSSDGKQISKASELRRWTPHKIISLLDPNEDGCYRELPGYKSCRILKFAASHSAFKNAKDISPPLRRFLSKLRRYGTFETLSILLAFDIILGHKNKLKLETPLKGNHHNIEKTSPSDDNALLVEGWPLIQNEISWEIFITLYRSIESQMCMVTLEHPLSEYAKRILFQIENEEFEMAMRIASNHKWIPRGTHNRLQASQFLLDYVASLTSTVVGVLLEDPMSEMNKPLPQSCLPLACLELSASKTSDQLQCKMISLYDMHQNEEFTVSTRSPPENCSCFKCLFEQDTDSSLKAPTNKSVAMAQRLAHVYFQQEKYDEAKTLYLKCHDFYAENGNKVKAADAWHSVAAVYLTELKFLQAQRHWKNGSRYQSLHEGIRLQLQEKQKAYGYFDQTLNTTNTSPRDYQEIGTSRRLFVCKDMLPPNVCRQLIEWATEYASTGEGWTTSRHYAVPTNDLPVHQVPKLLNWFVEWFRYDAIPLLQRQFNTHQHFYVHDAFLVRYSASSSSHFLPLHYDESTHSMVLALNSDFENGGTYFYSLDKTITPSCGSLVSFRGDKLLHGGNVVTRGERYILAVFLYVDKDGSNFQAKKGAEGTGTCLQASKRLKSNEGFSFGFF